MSIRKHWGKITLGIAASFWAGCNETTEPEYIQGGEKICTNEHDTECGNSTVIALYGVQPNFDISSGSVSGDCTEGNCAESSSGMGESSSSVNSEYPYVLYSDPSVHCKDSTVYVPSPCKNASKSYASTDENAPLYSIVPIVCNTPSRYDPIFKCDNGDSLSTYSYKEKDGIIYTNKEYDELFGSN